MKEEIKLMPPIEVRRNDNGFIIIDATQTTHYFNRNGTYDGWTKDHGKHAAKISKNDLYYHPLQK